MKLLKSVLLGLAVVAQVALAQEEGVVNPGWQRDNLENYAAQANAIREWIDNGSPAEEPLEGLSAPLAAMMSSSVGNEADAITPEIETLARGLLHDPVRIYAYCSNYIEYEHYFGSKKGATLTLLEGKGNSFDISALMVALLRASGYDASYRYGPRVFQDYELKDWLGLWYFGDSGVPFPHLSDTDFINTYLNGSSNGDVVTERFVTLYFIYSLSRGFPMIEPLDPDGFEWVLPHVWVQFEDANGIHEVDPSLKVLNKPVGVVGWEAAVGYNKTALMNTAANGGVGGTTGTNYATSLNETNLATHLTNYTNNLVQWLKTNHHDAKVNDLIKRSEQQIYTYTNVSQFDFVDYFNSRPWLTTTTWSAIPTNWMTKFTVTLGNSYSDSTNTFGTTYYNTTFNMPGLEGRKLALAFSGNTASLYLDDVLHGGGTVTPTDFKVRLTVDHPHGSYDFSTGAFTDSGKHDDYKVGDYVKANDNAYAIIYSFSPGGKLLRKRQNILEDYKRQGLADSTREVKTELLNLIGINWFLQTDYNDRAVYGMMDVSDLSHHRVGRMAQENAYFIDVGLQFSGAASFNGNNPQTAIAFQLTALLDSALEHGVIEQTQGSGNAAVSTVKILKLANSSGARVYRANSSNWSSVRNALENASAPRYTSIQLNTIKSSIIDEQGSVLLPWRPNVNLGSWTGYGYGGFSPDRAQMIISGGYNGGYLSEAGTVSAEPFSATSYFDPSFVDTSTSDLYYLYASLLAEKVYGADPVDLASGAFVYDKTDLVAGNGTLPRGLTFSRHYNSNRSTDKSTGLGLGWTHNLDIRLEERSSPLAGLGGATPFQMAPYFATWVPVKDLFTNGTTAKDWLTASLAINWLTEQLRYKAVSVVLGDRTLEFVKMPNGTFVSPPGVNLTLTINGSGNYVLTERHGNVYNFNASKRLATVVDQYGKTATFTYSSGNLTQVQDSFGRTLTFTWSGDKITKVADGSTPTRDVDFGYTGDKLVTAADPEDKTTTFGYTTDNRIDSITDGLNRVIVLNQYDARGRVETQESEGDSDKTWKLYYSGYETIEEDPEGGRKTYYFDANGRTRGSRNALGHRNGRSYDGQDRILLSYDELGKYTFPYYNVDNNVTQVLDPIIEPEFDATGRSTTRTYDSQKRLETVTDYKGGITTYTYNTKHQVLTVKDAKNIVVVTYTYDANGNLQTVKDAANNVTTYGYDVYGNVNRIDYPGGAFETFTYSVRGDLLTHVDARNNTTTYTHNKRREVLTVSPPGGGTVTNTYDNAANLASVTDTNGNTSSYTYSSTGKLLTTTLPTTAAGTATVTNTYDSRDWLVSTTDPLNRTTIFAYDAAGRMISVTDPLNRTITYAYDAKGQRVGLTDPLENATGIEYDDRGQTKVTTDALANTVINSYDYNGNRSELKNRRGQDYTFTHDPNNRPLTTVTPLGKTTTQTWNSRGLLETVQEPSGQTTTLGYDNRSRLTTSVDPDKSLTFGRDNNGNLLTVTNGTKTITRAYDARNRVTSYTDEDGNVTGYTYDTQGNLLTLTYPGGKVVTYEYDEQNRLKKITDWANRETLYVYDLVGRLSSITRPNGTVRLFTYDNADQTTRIEERSSGNAPFLLYKLGYDNAGRKTSELRVPLSQPLNPPTSAATYDIDNRLTAFNGVTVVHDDDGNMTSGPLTSSVATTYTYNASNWLTSAGGLTYQYDMEGHRTSVTQGSDLTRYIIDPNAPLSRVLIRTKPDNSKTFYVYGLGLVYEVDEAESTRTYHPDFRGSTVAITADNGKTVLDRIEYTPYGQVAHRTGITPTDTPFLYNGAFGVMSDSNGLISMRARFYNPYLGRLVSADPIKFGGGLNWYGFAENNPITGIDPDGEFVNFLVGAAIGIGVQAAIDVWRGESSSFGTYLGAAAGGALTGGASALIRGAGSAAIVGVSGGIVSSSTRQLVDNGRVEAGSALIEGAAGGLGGVIGQKAVPAALRLLSNQTKGLIGEYTSLASNLVRGNLPTRSQFSTGNYNGYRPRWDWEFQNVFTGTTTIVESKFGTAGLTAAQRAGANKVTNLSIERWTYDFWGQAGAVAGGITGSAGGRK